MSKFLVWLKMTVLNGLKKVVTARNVFLLLLKIGKPFLVKLIASQKLSLEMKLGVQTIVVAAQTLGKHYAKETHNDIDDQLVQEILELGEKVAESNNFSLPIVPEIN